MASIFNALHIGYTGLNAAQIGIDTTGHNISNAETEGYSRQRVVTSTAFPVSVDPGQRGNGTQITEIVRIYDSFVFNRYSNTAQSKSYSDTMKKHLIWFLLCLLLAAGAYQFGHRHAAAAAPPAARTPLCFS